jgi:hypothetical protein
VIIRDWRRFIAPFGSLALYLGALFALSQNGGGGASLYVGFFVLALALMFYLLPAIVAVKRRHPNVWAIGILNVLLGWTLIGWVAALVWSALRVEHRP